MPHPDLDLPALRAVAEAPGHNEWKLALVFDLPTVKAMLDRIDTLEKEGFALSANQCHAGYAGEFGHHCCREVDEWKARAEAAEKVANMNAISGSFTFRQLEAMTRRAEKAETALAEARASERDQSAKLIEAYLMTRKPGAERMVLAIAANIVRRGRELTAIEKLKNLKIAMDEHDEEMRAQAAKGGA